MRYQQVRKYRPKPKCDAVVQPGEYSIDVWDNKRCILEADVRDEFCLKEFCYHHWHLHNNTPEHIAEWENHNG